MCVRVCVLALQSGGTSRHHPNQVIMKVLHALWTEGCQAPVTDSTSPIKYTPVVVAVQSVHSNSCSNEHLWFRDRPSMGGCSWLGQQCSTRCWADCQAQKAQHTA